MVKKKDYVPDQGDILWITLSPKVGHEQSGRRPVIVLSPIFYNEKSKIIVTCPVTSKQKDYPFEVPIKVGDIQGVVLADHIRALDWRGRDAVFITRAEITTVNQVIEKINFLFKP